MQDTTFVSRTYSVRINIYMINALYLIRTKQLNKYDPIVVSDVDMLAVT